MVEWGALPVRHAPNPRKKILRVLEKGAAHNRRPKGKNESNQKRDRAMRSPQNASTRQRLRPKV